MQLYDDDNVNEENIKDCRLFSKIVKRKKIFYV